MRACPVSAIACCTRSRKYLRADMPRRSSSIPTVRHCRPRCLVETANVLAQPGERAVLGPCTDGGYYLLGLKTVHRRLFEDITWGTERVAAQTLERARELKLDVHMLPPWYDVDDVEGLRRLHGELGSARAGQAKLDPRTPYYPAATATLMRSLAAGALIGDRPESVPQIPLGSA